MSGPEKVATTETYANGLLQGLRIVECSAFVAAPLAGMTFAQLGADVIRIDPPQGGLDYTRWPVTPEGVSLFWAGMNKGKKSVVIDLARPEGRELAAALICAPGDNAGLFLTNFPPRGWLAYETLRSRRADLIHVNILGDRHGRSAVDYTVNCRIGFPNITGPAGTDEPVNHVLPAWDHITGMSAAFGLLAAERHRNRTGSGQYVKIALLDVALATVGHMGMIAEVEVNDEDRARHGNWLFGAFGRDFATRDGRRVMVVAITGRQWANLCAATNLQEAFASVAQRLGLDLSREGDRFRGRDAIAASLGPWIAARDLKDVAELFRRHDVCFGVYQSVRQLLTEDPEASVENPLFSIIEQPGIDRHRAPSSALQFSGVPHLPAEPAPTLGAHTEEVLSTVLHLSSAQIGRLAEQAIIGLGNDAHVSHRASS